jgi:dTDP-glucose 4,6-dehydratase
MKILVTGALGFIGSHFVDVAEAAGHQVDIIDSCAYSARSANLAPERRWHRCDIADQPMVEHQLRGLRPDWVVNLAAETHVARSIECRDEFLRTNVMGTNALLEACLTYWREEDYDGRFRVLHVSTDEVYGSLGPYDAPWTEETPYAPNNPYAASKAASDHIARAYRRTFGLPVIVTHSSNNYGPRQHPEKLIPTLVGQLLRGEAMTLHGDGLNVRDWLHVEDHCRGLLAALQHGSLGKTYNFGGECERTNLTIAHLVKARTGGEAARIEFIANRAGNDLRYSSSVAKARTDLYWTPGPPIEARLGDTLRWYFDHPDYAIDYGH